MKKLLSIMVISALSSSIAFGLSLREEAPMANKYQGGLQQIRIAPERQRQRELQRLNEQLANATDKKEIKRLKEQIKNLEKEMPVPVQASVRHVKEATNGKIIKMLPKAPVY